MENIESYKGIRPGKIIEYTLKEKNLKQKELANIIDCQPQVISAIIKGKREIPQNLTYKLDSTLGFETGFFMLAQTYYKIKLHAEPVKMEIKPPKIREVVFWDIDMKSLNWQKHKSFILKRIHERGNSKEIEAVNNYYDSQK